MGTELTNKDLRDLANTRFAAVPHRESGISSTRLCSARARRRNVKSNRPLPGSN